VVYLPNGGYWIEDTIILRGSLRKLMGCEARINAAKDLEPLIRFSGVSAKTVILEHLGIAGDVEHDCDQTLVIRKCDAGYRNTPRGTGDVFFEDGMFDHPRVLYPQNLWGRQINSEFGDRPNFTNRGGKAWILGMKVEGWVSAIRNIGGVTECYALYAMTGKENTNGTPFVENREGWVAVSLRDGGQGNHEIKLRDTWDGTTKEVKNWHREWGLLLAGQRFDAATSTPAGPGAAQGKAIDCRSVELSWGAAQAGPRGLSHYLIRRNGQLVAGVPGDKPAFTDRDLAEKTAYAYEISAVGQRGGISAPVKVAVTTPADSVAPTLTSVAIWPSDQACITLDFDEAMDAKMAANPASYALSPATQISKAVLSASGRRVVLSLAKPLGDGQACTLTYSGISDCAGNTPANPTAEFTAWQQGDGLRLEFWNAKDSFEGKPVATTTETRVDHWWGDGSPLPGVTPGAFSARWSGILRPRATGEYHFNTGVVSGCRIMVDGKVVHDQWGGGNEWTWSGPVNLEAGKHYNLVFETHAISGWGGARLKWSGPGIKDEFLNERVLFLPQTKP